MESFAETVSKQKPLTTPPLLPSSKKKKKEKTTEIRDKGFWKFNSSLTKNQSYIIEMKKLIDS